MFVVLECESCAWRREVQPDENDIVAAAVALDHHLVGEHNVTFRRADEEARRWLEATNLKLQLHRSERSSNG